MGKTRKKQMRQRFRKAVFKRDGYRCVMCGLQSSPERAEHELDAHHIMPREDMPHGGYVLENGITLCDPTKSGGKLADGCHYRAEERLRIEHQWKQLGKPLSSVEGVWHYYSSSELYKKIRSSYELARRASEYLK